MFKAISISSLLEKRNNNFELLRLIAALMVIYGHAYAITPQPPLNDFLGSHIMGGYSGSIAVKFFFLLSGLVVTNSLLRTKDFIKFFVSRIFRIFPALVVCAFITCYLFSPIFTTTPLTDYFSSSVTHQYFVGAITLNPSWNLPGVFLNNPTSAINGSLWTLPNEMYCYFLLVITGILANLRSKILPFLLAILAILLGLALFYFGVIPYPQAANSEVFSMRLYFFAGVLLVILKKQLKLSPEIIVALVVLAIMSRETVAFDFLIIPVSFMIALWLSSTEIFKRIRLPGDYSYGVYLYGFFIQQALKEIAPSMDLRTHQIIAMLIALIFGAISWHTIELPVMKFWQQFSSNFHGVWSGQKLREQFRLLSLLYPTRPLRN